MSAAEVYDRDEIAALLRAVGNGRTAVRNRALLVLLWRTGLRIGEALALRPVDVDHAAGDVHVLRGKGGKTRRVPIDPSAAALVREYQDARRGYAVRRSSPLFCTLEGMAVSKQYVAKLLTRLGARAGVAKRMHAHAFRHTYAAELLQEGFNVRRIQELLGHSNLAVTTRYLLTVGSAPELAAAIHARAPIAVEGAARARVVGIAASVARPRKT